MSRGYPAEVASNGGAKLFYHLWLLLSWFLVFKVFEVLKGNSCAGRPSEKPPAGEGEVFFIFLIGHLR